MPGVTAALLGDLSARRELGKVGTQSDIHLHDLREGGRHVTILVPDRYPEQLKCLSYTVLGADTGVLVVRDVDARLGEQILAADAAGLRHGIIVLTNYVQPEQLQPLIAGTSLERWTVQAEPDWPAVRAHVAAAPLRTTTTGPPVIPVDHHFDVKGVGAVILGVVRSGIIRKNDTLMAWPDKVICPVRSIQCHDVDVPDATAGDRVGLALRNTKAEHLDRGMVLAPADAPLAAYAAGDDVAFTLARSRFSRQPLAAGSVLHLGVGMQFVPARLAADAPPAGSPGAVQAVLEKRLVVEPAERAVAWYMDGGKQRVVGAVRFS